MRVVLVLVASTLSLVLVLGRSEEELYKQKLILYEKEDCEGKELELTGYEPSLHSKNFNNRACSARVNGIWLLYDFSNYNSIVGNGGTEYIVGRNFPCVNLNHLRGKVSSTRFGGNSADFRQDSLTLFGLTRYQGEEEYLEHDLPNLFMENVISLIVTGTSPWTLFEDPRYGGNAFCVEPTSNLLPAFLPQLNASCIQSARKGCFSNLTALSDHKTHDSYSVPR